MLTPVDIQQKKFHIGLGYDKKDVNTFFEAVAESYEQLYRSNAELKERVTVLTDGLQNYKSKEDALEKSLMRAEKDSEDKKSKASREAKTIELDAKNRAKAIIGDAEERLIAVKEEMELLKTQYAAYKSNFCTLMKKQYEFLKETDFDVDSYIDEKALGVLMGASGAGNSSSGQGFGSFDGDPQMRDESSLGGLNSTGDNTTSTSAVYTAGLNSNDNFVDPFNPNKDNGRYNPYDEAGKEKSPSDPKAPKQTSFKVADSQGNKNKYKRAAATAVKNTTESAATPSLNQVKPEVKSEPKSYAQSDSKPEVKSEPVNEPKPASEPDISTKPIHDDLGPIPTVNLGGFSEDDSELSGDIEINIDGKALLGDGNDMDDDSDEFGFEFVE